MSQETIERDADNPAAAGVHKRMLIGGELVGADRNYESINPATGQVLGTAPDGGVSEAGRAVLAAREAFDNSGWATDVELRRRCITQLAAVLREHADDLRELTIAEVGATRNLTYGNQLDAMKTMGMNPSRLLKTPILYAFLLGTPLLTMLSYAVAATTASVAFLMSHGELGIAFWDAHFHQQLRLPGSWLYKGSGWLIVKLLCCGAGIAIISWQHGSVRKLSGAEISHGVTRTILWATLYVLFIHFVFSLYEFQPQV